MERYFSNLFVIRITLTDTAPWWCECVPFQHPWSFWGEEGKETGRPSSCRYTTTLCGLIGHVALIIIIIGRMVASTIGGLRFFLLGHYANTGWSVGHWAISHKRYLQVQIGGWFSRSDITKFDDVWRIIGCPLSCVISMVVVLGNKWHVLVDRQIVINICMGNVWIWLSKVLLISF